MQPHATAEVDDTAATASKQSEIVQWLAFGEHCFNSNGRILTLFSIVMCLLFADKFNIY